MFSGSSIYFFILIISAFHVPVSFFHQKFVILSTPGAGQFFLFFSASWLFFSMISNFLMSITFSLFFPAVSFIHFLLGVVASSSHILQRNLQTSICDTFYFLPCYCWCFCKIYLIKQVVVSNFCVLCSCLVQLYFYVS